MIKRMCDRCGSDHNVDEYQLPTYAAVCHIMNCGKLIATKYDTHPSPQSYDLCEKCAHEITQLVSDFMKDVSN